VAELKTTVNSYEKLPPQNREAEMSVLGAMFFDEIALAKAIETLTPDFFYDQRHQNIFTAMTELFAKNHPVDLITVSEELKKRKQLDEVGGISYLTQLTTIVPTAANIEHYARIVKDKALLRKLIQSGTQIVQSSLEADGNAREMIDSAEKMIFEISQSQIGTRPCRSRTSSMRAWKRSTSFFSAKNISRGLRPVFTNSI
jgi:replicative DNA helicase